MSALGQLQEACLKLLITRLSSTDDSECVNLFDPTLQSSEKVKLLLTSILKIASGNKEAITELVGCFDFIHQKSLEENLLLDTSLHPQHKQFLGIIYKLLEKNQVEAELKKLNEFELALSSMLTIIASTKVAIIPEETLAYLQQALLGDASIQLEIINNIQVIIPKINHPVLTIATEQLLTISENCKRSYLRANELLLQAEDEVTKEDFDFDLIKQLYIQAYSTAKEAFELGYPDSEALLDSIVGSLYKLTLASFTSLQKLDTEKAKVVLPQVKELALQLKNFQHSYGDQLLELIPLLEDNIKQEEANKKLEEARKIFLKSKHTSNYKGALYMHATDLLSVASSQGLEAANELLIEMENAQVDKDFRILDEHISNWLNTDYKSDIDSHIIFSLKTLLNTTQDPTSYTKIKPSLIESIKSNLMIIEARNYIVENRIDEALDLLNKIKIQSPNKARLETIADNVLRDQSKPMPIKKKDKVRITVTEEIIEQPVVRKKKRPRKYEEEIEQNVVVVESPQKYILEIEPDAIKETTEEVTHEQDQPDTTKAELPLDRTHSLKSILIQSTTTNMQNDNVSIQTTRNSKRVSFYIYDATPTEDTCSIPNEATHSIPNEATHSIPNEATHSIPNEPIHSINTPKSYQPKFNKEHYYLGIGLLILGAVLILSGIFAPLIATGGLAAFLSISLISMGLSSVIGGRILAYDQLCPCSNDKKASPIFKKPSHVKLDLQHNNEIHHYNNPANLFIRKKADHKITASTPLLTENYTTEGLSL